MATEPAKNDSIITLGLDLAEETEQSAGVIASEFGKSGAELAGQEPQPTPQQKEAELQEAREIAERAREQEAAEQERQREQERSR